MEEIKSIMPVDVNNDWHGSYVNHFCKNRKCDENWVDKDITNAQTRPPQWKLCEKCCQKMGIDFNAQVRIKRKLSDKQQETLLKNQFQMRKKSL